MNKKPASYQVFLTKDAEQDLEDIYHHICQMDSRQKANAVLDKLVSTIQELSQLPERGSIPKELMDLGVFAFRQVLYKPYRMIYRVRNERVYVLLIADGRRDMRGLLIKRLIGG